MAKKGTRPVRKSKAAQSLARRRSEKLTPERRSEIARQAARKRWERS